MKFRKIFTSILLLLTSLLLISCNNSVSEDTIKKIEADINAIEELSIENNLLNLPNKGLVNGSDITWEIDFDNVVNNNIVIPSNHPDLLKEGIASATFKLDGGILTKDFQFQIPETENTLINAVKEVPFTNKTAEYEIYETYLNIYHNKNGVVPYVSVTEFVTFLKGLIDPNLEFSTTFENNLLELSYTYEDEDEIYELSLYVNANDNTIKTNNSGYFYGLVAGTETNFGRNIYYNYDSPLYHFEESNGYNLNLSHYGMDVINYDNNILIPFSVANLLFANQNYYSLYYNYDKIYGIYFTPDAEINSEILLSSKNNQEVEVDLLIHNFNFLVFFFDNFYGLKEYNEIETYYNLLLPKRGEFFTTSARNFDNNLFKFINKDIDELHTYYVMNSYYQNSTANSPEIQWLDDLGDNTIDYYVNGLYAVDDQIKYKWNVPDSYTNWASYHDNRKPYWFINDETIVISLDSFDTFDIVEDVSWNKDAFSNLLDIESIPSLNSGNRFIYFNNSNSDNVIYDVLIKDITLSDIEAYNLKLLNNNFKYNQNGFYSKLINNTNYLIQTGFDEEFNTGYIQISNQNVNELIDVDVLSLIYSDSAIYLEFMLDKALREKPNLKDGILDITFNMGGNIGALYRVIGMLFNEEFSVSNYDPNLLEYQTSVVGIDSYKYYDFINWHLLTSKVSFSAGNLLPTIVRQNNLAPIIGQTSGGGAASVIPVYLPIGTVFASSSTNVSALTIIDNDDYIYEINENGIEPDYYINNILNIYNNQVLLNIIKELGEN